MTCAWKELLGILPVWIAEEVENTGRTCLQELRLRCGKPPELVMASESKWLSRSCCRDDLNHCVNMASRYSPWAAQTASEGYITAPGGHRIGLCGDAVMKEGTIRGIKEVRMICIRVARDYPGIARKADNLTGSILLLGPPGSGKTTLLRDLVRHISETQTVAVVDERGELFPAAGGFDSGRKLDVLCGCPKSIGIDMVLRTMGPSCIAVDEITAENDCKALIRAGWCGVRLLATAHAANLHDLNARPVYRSLVTTRLFDHILILRRDKSWYVERMDL
ncbi:MAG: stage III sporulation protein AB [Oscillospiraceae bacterium]|nr:stage III sporulation protein AB [Oscillospiraceae bacterium]